MTGKEVIAYLQITADRFHGGSIETMIHWWESRNPEYANGLKRLYDEALAEAVNYRSSP